MNFQGLLASVGAGVVWQVLGSGFALLAALAAAVSLVQRRDVSPLSVVLGGAVAAAVVTILARIALLDWSADPEKLRVVLTTFAVGHLLGPLTVGPVVATTLAACAFAGFRWPPHRFGLPAIGALVAAVIAAGVVLAGGIATGNPLYPSVRALGYIAVGGVVALAMAGRHPAAGAAAGALLPLVVAVGEASERGLVNLLLVEGARRVPADKWPQAVAKMVEMVAAQWTAGWVALAVASAAAGLGLVAAFGDRGGRPREAVAAVLLTVVLAWIVLLGADLGAEGLAAMSLNVGGAVTD